jgi:hypothetical protein
MKFDACFAASFCDTAGTGGFVRKYITAPIVGTALANSQKSTQAMTRGYLRAGPKISQARNKPYESD